MTHGFTRAKRVVVGAVVTGALMLGTAGIAGAATVTVPTVGAHFNCANATKALDRIEHGESRIAAGLPKLTAAEVNARQVGNTVRADRLAKRIARYERAAFKTRLAKATAAIEAKCNVATPTPSSAAVQH